MNKLIDDTLSDDELLNEYSEATRPVVDKFEQSSEHAMLSLAVKLVGEEDNQGVQTFINATGFYGILAEGLYAELGDMISNGNMALFSIIRDVIRDLEEDFGIDPEEDIEADDAPEHYH